MSTKPPSPVKNVSRVDIPRPVERQLYAHSAGRCEFPGCNQFLLEHHVTRASGNFSEKAHVVAYSDGGPRSESGRSKKDLNSLKNLMLLCGRCHKLVDDDPAKYTAKVLREYKKDHEDRMYRLTEIRPDAETRVLRVLGAVRGQRSAIQDDAVRGAIGRLNFDPRDSSPVDFSALDESDPGYWQAAEAIVRRGVRNFVDRPEGSRSYQPVSVFGIARIPLLVALGSALSSKVPVSVYNRQLLADDWAWSPEGEAYSFKRSWIRRSEAPGTVLILSLSGPIGLASLPDGLRDAGSVMELTIDGAAPSRTCLATEASVEAFRACFIGAMQEIQSTRAARISIVPAVPTAAAIHVGRDMLPSLHPPADIYDWNGKGGYEFALTVNQHE